jgi:hypothetical protein
VHLDLTLQAQSVAGTTASRSYAMLTPDPTTVVIILAADAVGATFLQNGVQITQLTAQNPRVQVTDSSSLVYYAVTQGAAPSKIWMDAVDGGGAAATAWSVIGPVSSASPASPGQLVLVSTSGGAVQITLPSAVGVAGQRVAVKDASGSANNNNITLAASNAQTVDRASSVLVSTSYGSVTVVSDGASWWTVA